jgi:ATP-binding cassette, subfamily C, bacterial CydC
MAELLPWLQHMQHWRARLLLGALLMLLTALSAIGLLALSGWFITATGVTALLWAAGQKVFFDIYVPGGGIRFFALARTVARYSERVFNHNTVLGLLADLRVRHFSALAQLDGATLGQLRAAQWLNRLTADIDALDTLYLRLLAPPAVALLAIVLVCAMVALFHPGLALTLLLILLALLLLVTVGMAAAGRRLSASRVGQLDGLRVQCIEQMQGLAELSAAATLGRHQQVLLARSQQLLDEQLALQGRVLLAQALGLFGVLGASLLGLFAGVFAYQQGLLSGPLVVMIALALMALNEVFSALPAAFAQWGATCAAAARLNQQTAMAGRLNSPAAPAPIPSVISLSWQEVSVEHAGITQLNLHLPAGERLSLVGPSGCGKSTLAALAARLIDPDAGQVSVAGIALPQFDLDVWRSQLAYLTQETELLHGSIADNLLLGNPSASDEQLWQALQMVDLADTVQGFAAGLNTWVGETGKQLSGGEGRRLALARVLLRDAPMVILDEPFSGLDQATRERIKPGIDAWLQGRTTLLLGHSAEALPGADRLLSWQQLQQGTGRTEPTK